MTPDTLIDLLVRNIAVQEQIVDLLAKMVSHLKMIEGLLALLLGGVGAMLFLDRRKP